MAKTKPKRERPAKTVAMCSALKDPADPSRGRCMLPQGHDGALHDGLDVQGQRSQWPKT